MGTKSGGILFCRKAIVPPITSKIPIERLAYKVPRNLSNPMNYYDVRNRRLPKSCYILLASGVYVRVLGNGKPRWSVWSDSPINCAPL